MALFIKHSFEETPQYKYLFCSDTFFNLSWKVLTDFEIGILEKRLDFVPIQNEIKEPELKSDSEEFCGRTITKWHFRNDTTPEFSETSVFLFKST